MHEDQLTITVEQVRHLIADQFPQFRGQDIRELETAGTVNAIFRIGERHAARFPLRTMDPAVSLRTLEQEIEASREFHEYCAFPSPVPVGIGQWGAGFPMPWLVQTWIDGDVATPHGLSTSLDFARDLAHLISALRKVDLKGRTFSGPGRGGKLTDHDAWMEVCFEKSKSLLDVAHLRRMWKRLRVLPPSRTEAMCHKDLIPTNLLVKGERLIGVLDTGGFGPADPALDLVAGWHLLNHETRTTFRETLGVDDLEWQRGAAWAFQQAMGLVWYYKDTNPVMAELGRSTLSRLAEAEL
ncbi:aminoglycoside phosphotransferase family protein [Rhizobium wuzhouense]|uniref:Aminoglycoside phosphotransferase n=1 Tax=Rhizobium wuzhouense TaxID=1986026 RepID=A0ABX5NZA0_9HYPH|nr:aminoglycoside phosphotransferase family protein [Rhizobium wuzhouense]PYB77697.1 aminoglycoside phosphotransferase [Rhizobium wuzhouense]